jgi:hypothetical protein
VLSAQKPRQNAVRKGAEMTVRVDRGALRDSLSRLTAIKSSKPRERLPAIEGEKDEHDDKVISNN